MAGAVDGLALAAVTGSAAGGFVNYLGYFLRVPIPHSFLHVMSLWHVALGYLVWTFVLAHLLAIGLRAAASPATGEVTHDERDR